MLRVWCLWLNGLGLWCLECKLCCSERFVTFGLKAVCTAVRWGFCKILVLVLQVYLGLYPVWQAS